MKCKLFFCLIILALLITSCQQKSTRLRIGIIESSLDHYPLSYALEKGMLDKEKYSTVSFSTGKEAMAALYSGKTDMAILPFTYAWSAVSKGYPVKTVSFFERESEAILVLPDIRSKQDLNGKKVGMIKGSSQDVLWQDFAAREKLTCEATYFKTSAEAVVALERRELAAAVLYVPLVDKLSDNYRVMHWFDDSYSGYPSSDLVVKTSRLGGEKGNLIRQLCLDMDRLLPKINIFDEEVRNFLMVRYSLGEFQLRGATQHTRFRMGLDNEGKVFELEMAKISQSLGYINKIPGDSEMYADIGVK